MRLQAASDASRCSQDAATGKAWVYAADELGPRSFISTFYPDTSLYAAGPRHYAASVPARELSSSALWRCINSPPMIFSMEAIIEEVIAWKGVEAPGSPWHLACLSRNRVLEGDTSGEEEEG